MILDLKNLSSFFYEMWTYISPKGLLAESHDLIYNIFFLIWLRGAFMPTSSQCVSLKLCKHAAMESRWRPVKPWHALSLSHAEDPASGS